MQSSLTAVRSCIIFSYKKNSRDNNEGMGKELKRVLKNININIPLQGSKHEPKIRVSVALKW